MLEGSEVERGTLSGSGRVVGAASTTGEGIATEFHDDDEGPGFSFGEEVVHDPAGMALTAPAGFIFARAVLEIERGITLAALVIIRRRVNEGVAIRIGGFGKIPELAKLAMRHIFERVKILVLGGDFNGAAPTSGAVKEVAVGIGNVCAIDVDGVIVKSFVERPGVAGPCAVVTLCEWTAVSETDADGLSPRRHDTEFDPALGVDLRILFAALIGGSGFPIVGWLIGLRASGLECEEGNGEEEEVFPFHGLLE